MRYAERLFSPSGYPVLPWTGGAQQYTAALMHMINSDWLNINRRCCYNVKDQTKKSIMLLGMPCVFPPSCPCSVPSLCFVHSWGFIRMDLLLPKIIVPLWIEIFVWISTNLKTRVWPKMKFKLYSLHSKCSPSAKTSAKFGSWSFSFFPFTLQPQS